MHASGLGLSSRGIKCREHLLNTRGQVGNALRSGVNNQIGDFPVQGVALFMKLAQLAERVWRLQKRTATIATGAAPQILRCCSKIDYPAAGFEKAAVDRRNYGPAACCQDDAFQGGQLFDHFLLARAKPGFAFNFKNDGDLDPGRTFDFSVGIEEFLVQASGKHASHGGFSRTHQTDQEYAALICRGFAGLLFA